MKVHTIYGLASIALSIINYGAQAADQSAIEFKDARGSVLKLKFSAENTVSGTFKTAIASKECSQAIGIERPVIGYMVNNAITMSIVYPNCGSVLTFIGNIEKERGIIDTTAIVSHQMSSTHEKGPGTRFIGHDIFNRIES